MRIDKLAIKDFKNLRDFSIDFDEDQLTTVLIGQNGTGGSVPRDNYRIHHSEITHAELSALNGKIVLHFLRPYCPKANKIERL